MKQSERNLGGVISTKHNIHYDLDNRKAVLP